MIRILRIPKVRMAIVLSILSLVSIASYFSFELVFRLFAIWSTTLLTEFLLWKIRKVDPFLPSAGTVTALIVFLLSDPTVPLYLPILASILAVSGKQLFRFWGGHTFNPAAAGLFITSYFGNYITWWGANTGVIALFILLLGASFVSVRMMRQGVIVIAFLLTILILSRSLGQFTVGAFWFFTLVLLPEPMTAAHYSNTKILYGVFVGVMSFLVSRIAYITDPLLASLLLGNMAFKFVEKSVRR